MRQRDFERILDLSEDLRFTDNHRIEAGGHTEQMTDGAIAGMPIEVRRQMFGGKGEMGVGQKFLHATIPSFQLFDDRVDFHPVARRK